ncbi:hypothetical protein [Mangrovactinospora gilvigrisea]|uniref:hypothetical protein n=1 Tax=Mangrovactinospora gilvigrisea TaxID=1428644 RepID=UPI001587184E|nr:hypothetical protein [Mangrovactinospora gilvigrisea]
MHEVRLWWTGLLIYGAASLFFMWLIVKTVRGEHVPASRVGLAARWALIVQAGRR